MDSIGRPRKFLFPNQKEEVTVFTLREEIGKSKLAIENNREWKEIGDLYELLEGKISVRHQYHKSQYGKLLHYYHMKQKERPKAVVVCFHGLSSSQRIDCSIFANAFGCRGFEVVGFDQESHGRNVEEKKDRCMIMDYRSLVMNTWSFLEQFLEQEKERITPDIPIFFIGGSMGGITIIASLLEKEYLKKIPIEGAVIYCPAIENTEKPGFFTYTALVALSSINPSYLFGRSGMDIPHCSHFKDNLEYFVKHPDSYDGAFKIMTGRQIIDLGDYVYRNGYKITTPFVVMHGTKDNLCRISGSERFFRQAKDVEDKLLVRMDRMMHALTRDHCAYEVTRMSFHWINIRTNKYWREKRNSKAAGAGKRKKKTMEDEDDEEEECEGESSSDDDNNKNKRRT